MEIPYLNSQAGIYQSFEFHCWGMGADYKADYLDMIKKYSPNLQPLSEEMYNKLMQFFDEDFEYHMNNDKTT